jgi:hypothetical protein
VCPGEAAVAPPPAARRAPPSTAPRASPTSAQGLLPRHLRLSSRSPEWKAISEKEKQKLGLATEGDGGFWLAWDDFVLQFTDLSICHLINTSLFSFSKTWREESVEGSWQRPGRAGGCPNHPASVLANPQFRFDIPGRGPEEVAGR